MVEFVAAVTRPLRELGDVPLLAPDQARQEAEDLFAQFPIVYPDADVLQTALWGVAADQLSCFDAHPWAHAEVFGIPEILPEDFEHGRCYGTVRARNPFLASTSENRELPPLYDVYCPGSHARGHAPVPRSSRRPCRLARPQKE